MKTANRVTGNQPEPVKQRIYGSRPVQPIEGAANQPEVLPHTKIYGKKIPTISVRLKDSDREMVINLNDFNSDLHKRQD